MGNINNNYKKYNYSKSHSSSDSSSKSHSSSDSSSSNHVKKKEKDINLENIHELYTTRKEEHFRSTFDETFKAKPLIETADGKKFLSGLIQNKDELCTKLGIDSEDYDNIACVALALASQETGMGFEIMYKGENEGVGKFIRGAFKWLDYNYRGSGSASSGLTQMKIHDFINKNKLTTEEVELLKEFGIESTGVSDNNLYSEPDKAAVSTMIVLNSHAQKYDKYLNIIKEGHKIDFADNLSNEERLEKGNEILETISNIFEGASDKNKIKIRDGFVSWIESENGSKIGSSNVSKEYNEELQLNNFNKILKKVGSDVSLTQTDLDYIRYALTQEGQEMSKTEFLAFCWQNGTNDNSFKLDRLLLTKVKLILSKPEDFDYNLHTANVSTLTEMYKSQSWET